MKLQAALKAAPRDPRNVTLLAEALGAARSVPRRISVWRELAGIHGAAGRLNDRGAAVRAALALDRSTARRASGGRWGVSSRCGDASLTARRRSRGHRAARGRCPA